MITDFLTSIPFGVWLFFAVVVLVVGAIILYALYNKDEVFAEVSHGTTFFRLQAREKPQKRKRDKGEL